MSPAPDLAPDLVLRPVSFGPVSFGSVSDQPADPKWRSAPVARGPAARVRLIVCGEPERGDDGAGPTAVEVALPRLPPDVRARVEVRSRRGLDPVDLLDLPDAVVVVDCVVGVPSGSLVRCSLDELVGRDGLAPVSSHTLPVGDVLRLVQELTGCLPPGVFLGLGGSSFGFGAPLSGAVEGALPAFAQAIATEIETLVEGRRPLTGAS